MRIAIVAALTLVACSDAVLPAPTLAACVDPSADVLARASCTGAEPGCERLRIETISDLDGDGVDDDLVAQDEYCGATGNCSYTVYLSGHGCTRWAGEVGGVAVEPTAVTHGGVRDLAGYWKGGCVAMEGTGTTWAFDGRQYRAIDSYTCACPWDAPPDPARDPRCPSVAD